MTDNTNFDVIIVGGSYAGLSAGMALGRSLRRVLIIDAGMPCNRQTPHSQNFITHDGEAPAVIAEKGRAQVMKYDTVQLYTGAAVLAEKAEDGFAVTTEAGDRFAGSKIIFATGLQDIMPEIDGFAECWGISVIHCPYCHGYEFRSKRTGLMANSERAFHLGALVNNLTDNLTILTAGKAEFSDEQHEKFRLHNIQVVENKINKIVHENGQVKQVVFEDREPMDFDAVYAAIPFKKQVDMPVALGCELTEDGYIKADGFQKTSVYGVFACGDNSGMRSVANAIASGNMAGAMANSELTMERF